MYGRELLFRLLRWLAFYVVVLLVVAYAAGKLDTVMPVLTHLVSGFSGAGFAIMKFVPKKEQ